jgi:O-acetyl-ADP-ribose deacetylase (regulator of RNase III)
MPLMFERNSIVKMQVDAVVNAANTDLKAGGGVCGALFSAAGRERLGQACSRIGFCPTGEAVVTEAFDLPARYIIHTPEPVYQDGRHGEERVLRSCYLNSLRLAHSLGCASIAFPLISSGIYGYPKDQALHVAISAIAGFLLDHDMLVHIVLYDQAAFDLGGRIQSDILSFIDEQEVLEAAKAQDLRQQGSGFHTGHSDFCSINDFDCHLDEKFSPALSRLIKQRGMSEVEAYKKANLDRKLFSKIRSDESYCPSKTTALAFAVALQLDLNETSALLATAGYTLSASQRLDVIVRYFISTSSYDIHEINQVLFSFDQPLLGSW